MPSWIDRVAGRLRRVWQAAVKPSTDPYPGGERLQPTPGAPPPPGKRPSRTVTLRAERNGPDYRHLGAYLDADGNLRLDGQDLGPATAIVSDDGEYEWFETVKAADLPRLVAILGGQPGDDILDLLERNFTGVGSYEFEKRLRESGIPRNIDVW